jgi:Dolichyl-phosphate-mannose-protein mannosyltransferase
MSRRITWAALATSVVLLAIRLYAAGRLGFGDAEALYACYARHPQPVYVDHPGLIGVIARAFGRGGVPTPYAAHVGTTLLATATPWVAALAARSMGASWPGAALAAFTLMLVPEISVGLFGLTPDLPLILLWYTAVGLSALGILAKPGSARELAFALGSGFAVGLACDAKVSGVVLLAGLITAWASPTASDHRKSVAPYAALAVALLLFSPVVLDEIQRGFPMLRHRLVDTQHGAGFSLRNIAALAGGQLLYVTPPLLVGAYHVARDLYSRRKDEAVSALLWSVTVAALPLVLLSCFSRVAEPHWMAPIYLALPLHLARRADFGSSATGQNPREGMISPWLARLSVVVGLCGVAFAHAWVLLPLGPALLGKRYVARYDLANDLFAWRSGMPLVRRALVQSLAPDEPPVVVVGPHWTVCAQLHADLPPSVLVGCEGDIPDDFERWLPQATWDQAPVILYVTDDRFVSSETTMPHRRADAVWHVDVLRGGVAVRRIIVERLALHANASLVNP